jgi:hypothetical protein
MDIDEYCDSIKDRNPVFVVGAISTMRTVYLFPHILYQVLLNVVKFAIRSKRSGMSCKKTNK